MCLVYGWHFTDTYSLYLDHLWFSALTAIHCSKEFFGWHLRVGYSLCVDIYFLVKCFPIFYVDVCIYGCIHTAVCVGDQRTACRSRFFVTTVWALGIELSSAGLGAGVFTGWVILPSSVLLLTSSLSNLSALTKEKDLERFLLMHVFFVGVTH